MRFIITPDLVKILTTATYHHPNPDDFDKGIQPFFTGYYTQMTRRTILQKEALYNTLQNGGYTTMQESNQLKEEVKPPQIILQATYCLKSFTILL